MLPYRLPTDVEDLFDSMSGLLNRKAAPPLLPAESARAAASTRGQVRPRRGCTASMRGRVRPRRRQMAAGGRHRRRISPLLLHARRQRMQGGIAGDRAAPSGHEVESFTCVIGCMAPMPSRAAQRATLTPPIPRGDDFSGLRASLLLACCIAAGLPPLRLGLIAQVRFHAYIFA